FYLGNPFPRLKLARFPIDSCVPAHLKLVVFPAPSPLPLQLYLLSRKSLSSILPNDGTTFGIALRRPSDFRFGDALRLRSDDARFPDIKIIEHVFTPIELLLHCFPQRSTATLAALPAMSRLLRLIETRSFPNSLAATRRGFTFYVADPIGSILR